MGIQTTQETLVDKTCTSKNCIRITFRRYSLDQYNFCTSAAWIGRILLCRYSFNPRSLSTGKVLILIILYRCSFTVRIILYQQSLEILERFVHGYLLRSCFQGSHNLLTNPPPPPPSACGGPHDKQINCSEYFSLSDLL